MPLFIRLWFKTKTLTGTFASPLLLFLLLSCSANQQNVTIKLAETPLYPLKQWAVVKIPYIKISEQLDLSESLLGMVRLGDIVEVQRVEANRKDQTMWAFIVSRNPEQTQAKQGQQGQEAEETENHVLRGWVPYSFLYLVSNYVEGKLVSQQMAKPEQIFLDPNNENLDNKNLAGESLAGKAPGVGSPEND